MSEGHQQFYRNPDHDQPSPPTSTKAEQRTFAIEEAKKAREKAEAENALQERLAAEDEMYDSRAKDPGIAALDAFNRGRAGNEHIVPIDPEA